jgi:3-oxoacyl-[acyl-carrier-protein] synthase II
MTRVVITGMEVATGFGLGVDAFWNGLVHGRNAIRPITRFDAATLPVAIGCDVPDFDYEAYAKQDPDFFYPLPESFANRFSLWTTHSALRSSGLDYRRWVDPTRVGVFLADRENSSIWQIRETAPCQVASAGGNPSMRRDRFVELLRDKQVLDRRARFDRDRISVIAQRRLGIEGPNVAIGTACASGNNAIGEAASYIHEGLIDIAVAGGAYELDLMAMVGFARLGALSTHPDPDTACRPFDKDRSGFVMASGAGVLVIESLQHALKRGAPILAEVSGFGGYCDAYRATDPHPEADGAYASIRRALTEARLDPSQIDYVAAHGTSTKLNDRTESIALKRALGQRAHEIPVSSTKSMVGHTIMAAGALQAVSAIKTMQTGLVHPTRNHVAGDETCDLDYVPGEARSCKVDAVLSNSFGFGGQNASVIFRRFES